MCALRSCPCEMTHRQHALVEQLRYLLQRARELLGAADAADAVDGCCCCM